MLHSNDDIQDPLSVTMTNDLPIFEEVVLKTDYTNITVINSKRNNSIEKELKKTTNNTFSKFNINNDKLERVGAEHVCKIIELLREHPILWNTKFKPQYLRKERQRIFEFITDNILEEYPMLDIDTTYVINKIRDLKHLYHNYNNLTKHTENQEKYYQLLHFLKEEDSRIKSENSACTWNNVDLFFSPPPVRLEPHGRIKRTKVRICEYCGYQFKAQKNLQAHKKAVHFQLRPHNCSECNKSFKTREMLRTHRNSVHLDIRNHICDVCSKAFYDRKTMVQHKRLHSDAMNYVCRVCKKAFRQAPALHSHMRKH